MPRKRTIDAGRLAKDMSGHSAAMARAALISLKIKASTLRQYESHRAGFRAFLAARGAREGESEKDAFFVYLDGLRMTGGPVSAGGLRSALLHFQHVEGTETWAGDEDVKAAVAGFGYLARKEPEQVRGTITQEMLKELLEWLRRGPHRSLEDLVVVTFGVALRGKEAIAIRSGDYVPYFATQGGVLGVLRHVSNKGFSAVRSAQPRTVDKDVLDERANEVLRRRQAATPAGELLFPAREGNRDQLRRAIKEGAAALKWDPRLVFDGAHCLRHGGVGALTSRLEGEALKRAVRMSPSMVRHYARPNAKRLAAKKQRAR
jgi:hypothetical protein